jgi:pimeloyl-ACP methyl ester carboxylesterase
MRTERPLPYHEIHGGEGPALLLVHGMLSSRAQWTPNLQALRAVSRPVVVELYGHGRSPSPEDPAAYRPESYLEAFEAIRERVGVSRWMVLGQSLGAALTGRYAIERPDRVAAQILTNSNSAFAEPGWSERIRSGLEAFRASALREGLAALERMPIHPRHAKRLAPDVRAALLEDAARHDPRGVALTAVETTLHSALGTHMARNRVPSLLVCGRHERAFAPQRARAEREMRGLEVVLLDGGHAVNLDAPDAFNVAVGDFITKHADGV